MLRFQKFTSCIGISWALWAALIGLFAAIPSPAQGADSPKPPIIQVNEGFGGSTFTVQLHQNIPDMLRIIELEAGQEATPIQLYQKAALLDFFQNQKAYQTSPQSGSIHLKFLELLAFFKVNSKRKLRDDDPELLRFLSERGITAQQMNIEFKKQMDLQVSPNSGLLQCILTNNSIVGVTIHLDKIKIAPFSALDGDLPPTVAARLPKQIMTLLQGDNQQQIDATCSDLVDLRSNLANFSREASAAMPGLVRLEYLYDSENSVLTLKAGTLHTVSDVFISRYNASGEGGLTRKRDIERLLRARLQNREVKRGEVANIARKVVSEYLGRHKRPQPDIIKARYEENESDLSGLVGLEVTEGPYLPKPGTLSGGVETDVPSGRFTERASLAYENFLNRGIRLSASGSTGGEDGASLQVNAPSGIFRDREWQVGAASSRLPQIRLATGLFTEQRNLLEFALPLSSAHPPDDAPFYARYFATGFRYRVGQYELTSGATGARQRYTVGVLGFSWRQDLRDYWGQPPTPRSLLDAAAPPMRKGRFPFQLDVDAGSKLLGGDQYFLRAVAEARTHFALSRRWLLALRAGAAWSTSSAPVLEQPALGGDTAPALLRTFNPEYFRGTQVGSGTVELRYFTRDDIALTIGGDSGIADGGAAPSRGIKTGAVAGVYWLHARPLGGQSLGLFWAGGAGKSRWSLALTAGF